MGRIVVTENVTLDGVTQDPTGEEGRPFGGWFDAVIGTQREAWAEIEFAEAVAASALLLGRRSDAYFGARWNAAPGEWADRLRALPKYVVSSTITETVWQNGTVISGNVAEELRLLRDRVEGDIVVYASQPLVHALFENDLVDELRLFVFPILAGGGDSLFAALRNTVALRRLGASAVGESLIHQRYEVVR
jgi:dihydrofolate reductase